MARPSRVHSSEQGAPSSPILLRQLCRADPARAHTQIIKELHASCAPTDDGADVDSSKGTLQLEVYALEIQMYGEMKNNKKLRVRVGGCAF